MNSVLHNLLKLQVREFGDAPGSASTEAEITELRGLVPQPILGHYDRLRVRGKKGVAVVRNQACTGCHMRQPIGKITVVMRGEDIQLCDSCGRYLYFPDQTEGESVEPVAAAKPAQKPAPKRPTRKRALTNAA